MFAYADMEGTHCRRWVSTSFATFQTLMHLYVWSVVLLNYEICEQSCSIPRSMVSVLKFLMDIGGVSSRAVIICWYTYGDFAYCRGSDTAKYGSISCTERCNLQLPVLSVLRNFPKTSTVLRYDTHGLAFFSSFSSSLLWILSNTSACINRTHQWSVHFNYI